MTDSVFYRQGAQQEQQEGWIDAAYLDNTAGGRRGGRRRREVRERETSTAWGHSSPPEDEALTHEAKPPLFLFSLG